MWTTRAWNRKATTTASIICLLLVGTALGAMADHDPGVRPVNDDFADSELVPFGARSGVSTQGATVEAGEQLPCGLMGSTVWFRFQGDGSNVSVETFGSEFDTVVAAYTGESLQALELVDCNDDTRDLQSQVVFETVNGTTYYVQAGGYYNDTGTLEIRVGDPSPIPPPPLAYVERTEIHSRIGCGVGTIGLSWATCSALSEDDGYQQDFEVVEGLATLVVTLDWEPSSDVTGQELSLAIEDDGTNFAGGWVYAKASGPPPLEVRIDDMPSWEALDLQVRIFAHGDPVGVTYDQPYTLTIDEFYFEPAPGGPSGLPEPQETDPPR